MDIGQKHWKIAFFCLLFLQLSLAVFFGTQKESMHNDEFYSYYSTNGLHGLSLKDREWNDTALLFQELIVTNEGRFHYANVYKNQEKDVHPPLYYFLLHTVCSLFPNMYSKWFGLVINLIFFILTFFLLGLLSYELTKDKILVFLTCFLYGFSPGTLSGIVFIRMYMMLAFWFLLLSYVHLKMLKRRNSPFSRFQLFFLSFVILCGCLTQYYFLVFLFFISFGYSLFLLREKRWKEWILYGISVLGSIFIAFFLYPASFSHIFTDYRGKDVQTAFWDQDVFLERLLYFFQLINEHSFYGTLIGIFLFFLVSFLILNIFLQKKWKSILSSIHPGFSILFLGTLGYFLIISKITLMLGEESNRYFVPILGLLYFFLSFVFVWIFKNVDSIFSTKGKGLKIGMAIVFLFFTSIYFLGYTHGHILFLYPEQKEQIAFAKKHRESDVIVLSHNYWIWNNLNEIIQYKEIFYVQDDNMSPLIDERIQKSSYLIAYVNNMEEEKTEPYLTFLKENTGMDSYELLYKTRFYDVYSFQR